MSVNTGLNINTGRPLDLGRGGTSASLTATNNNLVYSTSSELALLATANDSLLVTNGSGVPALSTTMPNGIHLGIPGSGDITNCTGSPTLGSVAFSPTTHGIVGTTSADNALAGYVGEFIGSNIPFASAISLTNMTPVNLTSISLSAGDWDVFANVYFATVVVTSFVSFAGLSQTSLTIPDFSFIYLNSNGVSVTPNNYSDAGCVPYRRFNISSPTVIYLVAQANFVAGSTSLSGGLYARRVR